MRNLLFILVAVAIGLSSCSKSDEADVYNPASDGLVGNWKSSGANVAVLLSSYFKVDSILARFDANNTYYVESYALGTKTIYSGTYVQTKPATGSIWTIILNQSTPTAVTSEGIFEITKAETGYTMKYELVQTTPSINATPPTIAAGFGSTNGGKLGTMNIQTFVQVVK